MAIKDCQGHGQSWTVIDCHGLIAPGTSKTQNFTKKTEKKICMNICKNSKEKN